MSIPAARRRRGLLVLAVLASQTLGGCAAFSRASYDLNRAIGMVVLEPVATVYQAVLPKPVRQSVTNFFDNLSYPNVILNDVLQGKFREAGRDLGRFAANSTIGLAGLFDVATSWGLPAREEDFGQTLAVWGVPSGEYFVLPLFGPTTPRDSLGIPFRLLATPTTWLDVGGASTALTIASYVNDGVERRDDLRFVEEEAADPYTYVKEAWLQRRRFLIHDGNPPDGAGGGGVEGLEDLDLDALPDEDGAGRADDLPGLDDVGGGGGGDDLPGLDDLPGADDLPGLEDVSLGGPRRIGARPRALPPPVVRVLPRRTIATP